MSGTKVITEEAWRSERKRQRQFRKMAQEITVLWWSSLSDRRREDLELAMVRASGDAVCEKCDLPLRDHPYLSYQHLYVGCDGQMYHL